MGEQQQHPLPTGNAAISAPPAATTWLPIKFRSSEASFVILGSFVYDISNTTYGVRSTTWGSRLRPGFSQSMSCTRLVFAASQRFRVLFHTQLPFSRTLLPVFNYYYLAPSTSTKQWLQIIVRVRSSFLLSKLPLHNGSTRAKCLLLIGCRLAHSYPSDRMGSKTFT